MAFGAFDFTNFLKGQNNKDSSDPSSPYYAGGSYNKSYETVARNANNLFRQINKTPIVGPDSSGFMPYQREGMNVFARNLFSANSGQAAARGSVMPQNFDAVVGSALTQALPNLFSLQNQNQFIPGQIANDRMSLFNPVIQAGSTSLAPGVGYNNINSANQNYWQMMNNIGSSWGGKGGAMGGMGGMG